MIGTWPLPNQHYSICAVQQYTGQNVKVEKDFNILVQLWLYLPKGLLYKYPCYAGNKHKLRFKKATQLQGRSHWYAGKKEIVSLSQLCLNCYDNTALNLTEANFNSDNPQNDLKIESDINSPLQVCSQNNNYKEKKEFLQ
jgi:hypothetical protein